MKLELRTVYQKEKPTKRTKPVDHFKKCPNCGETGLIRLDPDVLCSSCDWDSMAWDVSRGAMNDLERAAQEIFKTKPVLIVSQSKKSISSVSNINFTHQTNEDKKGA